MKFETSIITSVLMMAVVASPIQTGNNELTAFGDFDVVESNQLLVNKRSADLRKPTFPGHSSAVSELNELYKSLMWNVKNGYNDAESFSIFVREFEGSISTVQHVLKSDLPNGAFGGELAHIKLIFEAFKDAGETYHRFDGCEYPGAAVVQRSMDLRVKALAAETFEDEFDEPGDAFKNELADIKQLFFSIKHIAAEAQMVPGLRRMFEKQVVKISSAIEKYESEEEFRKSREE
ncbi:hypothetical protein OXX80_012345 [Metschnikowia pulcherrima]